MVTEIKLTGAEAMLGLARASPGGAGPVRTPPAAEPEDIPEAPVRTRHAAFAALASVKDEAVQVAVSVRLAGQALERVEAAVQGMRDRVQFWVKNYPPFPPGSEQRREFLASLSALRRELDSLTVPPPQGRPEPVFYPRTWDLPVLDPDTASDEDVLALGRPLDELARQIDTGRAELAAIIGELPAWLAPEPGASPGSDETALDTSRAVAARLPGSGASLLVADSALSEIAG